MRRLWKWACWLLGGVRTGQQLGRRVDLGEWTFVAVAL